MKRTRHFCAFPGCNRLTDKMFCEEHESTQKEKERQWDISRGTAAQRGYSYRWAKYSKAFLSRPENQFCRLHLDEGCAIVAQCVDHIVPPSGPDDPLFWDSTNHQPACIHCNSKKGHTAMAGTFEFGESKTKDKRG